MKRGAVLLLAAAVLLCAACEKPHIHEYKETFYFDENCHWRDPLCEDTQEKADLGEHVFEDRKCLVCGYEKPKPPLSSDVFSQNTQKASLETLERANQLLKDFERLGFSKGDLYVKEHVAEGTSAQDLEARIENFEGLKDITGVKASLVKLLPSFSGTKRQYYYADESCAVEDFGSEKNYYKAAGTLGYLLEDVFMEIESQMDYSLALLSLDPEIGYASGDYEIVKLTYGGGSDRSDYTFVFEEGTLSGLRAYRSYQFGGVATVKQIELLIGDYEVTMPDTTGFRTFEYLPKWAAGYPGEEVFIREFLPATAQEKAQIKDLFKGTSSGLSRSDNTQILSDGDIHFIYRTPYSENDITIDRDEMGMRVHEISSGLLSDIGEDGKTKIEHYVDAGVCYETLNGKTKAYVGSYAQKFYSMLFYSLRQLCEFVTQYLNADSEGHPEAYELYVNMSEYTAVKLVVPECGEMIYIYDFDGKLLAIKINLNQTEAILMVGDYNVEIPAFSNPLPAFGEPNTGYLGV